MRNPFRKRTFVVHIEDRNGAVIAKVTPGNPVELGHNIDFDAMHAARPVTLSFPAIFTVKVERVD